MSAWKCGCVFGLTSVILGAFGAHGLQKVLEADPQAAKKIDNWNTAVKYQMVHSLALLAWSIKSTGLVVKPAGFAIYAPILFTTGVLAFSGSIYLIVILDPKSKFRKVLIPATPIGGLILMAGWASAFML